MGSIETAWVLVIEDLRDQAELCTDICAEAGLNTMTAANGGQGLRKASELQPSVILLDLMLPDIDGWEVCRRLKDDGRTSGDSDRDPDRPRRVSRGQTGAGGGLRGVSEETLCP
jgi:CheY-like chemotaxis protein